MPTYQTHVTIEEPGRVVLSNLPFRAGERVEVTLRPDDSDQAGRGKQLEQLLRETQALPQAQSVTEDEVRAEIAAFRNRR